MTKQEVVQKVEQSVGSLFTKEDVLQLIESISGFSLDEEQVRNALNTAIDSSLSHSNGDDIVDYDSAEFELDSENRIGLTEVDILTWNVAEIATDAAMVILQKLLQK